jgi:hypothetical protein
MVEIFDVSGWPEAPNRGLILIDFIRTAVTPIFKYQKTFQGAEPWLQPL